MVAEQEAQPTRPPQGLNAWEDLAGGRGRLRLGVRRLFRRLRKVLPGHGPTSGGFNPLFRFAAMASRSAFASGGSPLPTDRAFRPHALSFGPSSPLSNFGTSQSQTAFPSITSRSDSASM